MRFLDRIFGPRLDPKARAENDPDLESIARASDDTLRQVAEVLSPERRRVAESIRSTATAVRKVQDKRMAREH